MNNFYNSFPNNKCRRRQRSPSSPGYSIDLASIALPPSIRIVLVGFTSYLLSHSAAVVDRSAGSESLRGYVCIVPRTEMNREQKEGPRE